jgi:hypothetical protein
MTGEKMTTPVTNYRRRESLFPRHEQVPLLVQYVLPMYPV